MGVAVLALSSLELHTMHADGAMKTLGSVLLSVDCHESRRGFMPASFQCIYGVKVGTDAERRACDKERDCTIYV
jgi:hypothetical protein